MSRRGCSLYMVAWAFYLVMAIAAVVWVGLREGDIPTALFLDPRTWYLDLGLGVGAALLLVGLWEGVRRFLESARQLEEELAVMVATLRREEAAALALLSGFAEEFFFRGAVQGTFGIFLTTIVFALVHRGPTRAFRIWPLFALLAGGLFGGLMLWRGNLLAPVTAHILVNGIGLWRLGGRLQQGKHAET